MLARCDVETGRNIVASTGWKVDRAAIDRTGVDGILNGVVIVCTAVSDCTVGFYVNPRTRAADYDGNGVRKWRLGERPPLNTVRPLRASNSCLCSSRL